MLTLMFTVFSHRGVPLSIVADNGVQFCILNIFLIGKTDNTPQVYYPATNGVTERFKCVLKQNVQSAIQKHPCWKQTMIVFHVYQSTQHAPTGSSPYDLLHGHPWGPNWLCFCAYTACRDRHSPQSQCPTAKDENLHQLQMSCEVALHPIFGKMGWSACSKLAACNERSQKVYWASHHTWEDWRQYIHFEWW